MGGDSENREESETKFVSKFIPFSVRIFVFSPREGLLPNHGYESRAKLIAIYKDGV